MWYALLIVAAIGLLTSTGFAAIVLWAVPGYLRERRHALATLRNRPGFTPPLSLLKPLHGTEPGLEADLESFFFQDYPNYEILFCTRAPDDPGLSLARSVAARHPTIPTQFLSTNGQPDYINAKVASMERMELRSGTRHPRHQRQRRPRLTRLSALRCVSLSPTRKSAASPVPIAESPSKAAYGRRLKPSACRWR